jgi:hypothetical protein
MGPVLMDTLKTIQNKYKTYNRYKIIFTMKMQTHNKDLL